MGDCYIEDNANELKQKIGKNKLIVLVYAPWCGHCKEMKGEWEKVVEHLGNRDDLDGFISKIQLDEIPKLKKPVLDDIKGVPTLIYLNKGENSGVFEGERDAEHIEDWILDKLTDESPNKMPDESPNKMPDEKTNFAHDLGKLTEDSIVLKKRRGKHAASKRRGKHAASKRMRKHAASKRMQNRRSRLTNISDKIGRMHTMYGGYNWQKSSNAKNKRSKKNSSNNNLMTIPQKRSKKKSSSNNKNRTNIPQKNSKKNSSSNNKNPTTVPQKKSDNNKNNKTHGNK